MNNLNLFAPYTEQILAAASMGKLRHASPNGQKTRAAMYDSVQYDYFRYVRSRTDGNSCAAAP